MSDIDPNVKITNAREEKGCKGFIGSIVTALIGFLLFLGSFYVLFSNEQQTDFSKIAKTAIAMTADALQTQGKPGDLVAITGDLYTNESITVDEYLIPGKYIAMDRHTEIYAWSESSSTETRGEEKITTYDYKKKWTNNPIDSSKFHNPTGHKNVDKTIEDKHTKASTGIIGKYTLSIPKVNIKSASEPFILNENTVIPDQIKNIVDNKYLYFAINTQNTPEIGDQRISYSYIPSNINGTIFGIISGTQLEPFITKKKEKLFSFRKGNFEEAVDSLRGEYLTGLWLMRGLGFVLMLVGMLMFFGPLFYLLDIIPILGDFAGGLVFLILLIVAIILSAITIFAGFLFKNIIYIIAFITILVIIGIAIIVILLSIARKRQA